MEWWSIGKWRAELCDAVVVARKGSRRSALQKQIAVYSL
jgi:hypothetical protein